MHHHRANIKHFYEIGNVFGSANVAFMSGALTALGQGELAARLLGAAETMLFYHGTWNDPMDQAALDSYIAATRAALGEEYERYYQEGRRLSLDEAVHLALSAPG